MVFSHVLDYGESSAKQLTHLVNAVTSCSASACRVEQGGWVVCKRAIVQERDYGSLLQRFADAMLNNDTASPHRLSNFKGFFRGEGRLDAKRLDKQL